jgi:diacylglycerol kinase family enzyme
MSAHKMFSERKVSNVRKAEPFVPLAVAKREPQRYKIDTMTTEATSRNKEIEIFIDNDGEDRDCLKKLFKKIHLLTDQLADSERERVRMQLELEHLGRRDVTCKEHEKIINRLDGDLYKMKMENDILRKKSRLYDEMVPKEKDLVI